MVLNYWARGGKERIYINRSGQNDRMYSVNYWIEPVAVSPGLRDWQFRVLIKDAESSRRRREIETEFQHFLDNEFGLFLQASVPIQEVECMKWADWVVYAKNGVVKCKKLES